VELVAESHHKTLIFLVGVPSEQALGRLPMAILPVAVDWPQSILVQDVLERHIANDKGDLLTVVKPFKIEVEPSAHLPVLEIGQGVASNPAVKARRIIFLLFAVPKIA
jgi:hypothetical protein